MTDWPPSREQLLAVIAADYGEATPTISKLADLAITLMDSRDAAIREAQAKAWDQGRKVGKRNVFLYAVPFKMNQVGDRWELRFRTVINPYRLPDEGKS